MRPASRPGTWRLAGRSSVPGDFDYGKREISHTDSEATSSGWARRSAGGVRADPPPSAPEWLGRPVADRMARTTVGRPPERIVPDRVPLVDYLVLEPEPRLVAHQCDACGVHVLERAAA
jgi:hypothetical protein